MPTGIRYLAKALPPLTEKTDPVKMIAELHQQINDRLRHMYVEEGAAASDAAGGGVSLTFSLIHILLVDDVIASEDYFTGLGHQEVLGNGILFIAWQQPLATGHRVVWDTTQFHGPGTFSDDQWHVSTKPNHITVMILVRNPDDSNKWWLVGALPSYEAPETEE